MQSPVNKESLLKAKEELDKGEGVTLKVSDDLGVIVFGETFLDDCQYKRAVSVIDSLMDAPEGSDEAFILEVLAKLVSDYESKKIKL